jgi:hypothetical protein
MSTMNLTPKNPMLIFGLIGVAYVVWSSQKANAQGRAGRGRKNKTPHHPTNRPGGRAQRSQHGQLYWRYF